MQVLYFKKRSGKNVSSYNSFSFTLLGTIYLLLVLIIDLIGVANFALLFFN